MNVNELITVKRLEVYPYAKMCSCQATTSHKYGGISDLYIKMFRIQRAYNHD